MTDMNLTAFFCQMIRFVGARFIRTAYDIALFLKQTGEARHGTAAYADKMYVLAAKIMDVFRHVYTSPNTKDKSFHNNPTIHYS